MNICDRRFRYVSAAATNVAATFQKHGFRVRSYEEQKAAAQERMRKDNVTQLRRAK